MAQARKILIVDPDPTTARQLAPSLRQRGYQVHGARDGTRALEVAILRFPDLVLFDERTPLLDARTFLRILRTNPRTERIPVVLTGESADPDKVRVGAFLKKPFNQDEVLARIEQVFRKVKAARAVSGEGRELEGNLAQIPLGCGGISPRRGDSASSCTLETEGWPTRRLAMVLTVFRNRLRPEAQQEYLQWAACISELARRMPGYVSHKGFVAEDGERVTIVEFESEEAQRAWRMHPEHIEAQKKGRQSFYSEFRLQICSVQRETAFPPRPK